MSAKVRYDAPMFEWVIRPWVSANTPIPTSTCVTGNGEVRSSKKRLSVPNRQGRLAGKGKV